ncbi:hypothetical protein QUF80_19820 [Desulfococcaceae bacterium HSG8]|nr:hypothetical protein [Desulfococcaceae bacterium HSG8]
MMKIMNRPTAATVFMGLVFGLSFIPMTSILNAFIGSSAAFRFTIWSFLAVYAMYLARLGKVGITSFLFPLMIPAAFILSSHSDMAFCIFILGILAWIRSGICFPGSLLRVFLTELIFNAGGGLLLWYFSPRTPVAWALGIWMFFLIQSLCFVFTGMEEKEDEISGIDPFDRANQRAEEILSG